MSTRNPIATEDQLEIERRGVEFFSHPRLVSTMKEVKDYWIDTNKPSAEMLACLEDWAFEEVMFAAMIWSLNQDPLYPRVVTITRLAHQLGDLQIPGTRWGIDNPDSVYRVIPISGDEKYRIRGKVAQGRRLTENYFTLWDKQMNSVDVLNGKELKLASDGSFEISVDSDPAGDRPNHIRSSPAAHEFYIRDVVMDWEKEMINDLSIERLGATPSRPPFSFEQQLDLTAEYMWKWVKDSDRWNAQSDASPVNELAYTIDRDTDGGMRNQIYIFGKFLLPSSEHALILDVNLGGADYFIAPVSNRWGTTNEVLNGTGSLNRAQSIANPDGSLTYVLSVADPGVHNWLDTSGMHEGVLTLRWAEFSGDEPGADLAVTSRLVSLSDLEKELPAGTRFVTPAERTVQLRDRARSYAWRLAE